MPALEGIQDIVWKRSVEVIGNGYLATKYAELAGMIWGNGDQARDGDTTVGDGDFLAQGHAAQERAKMGPGIVDVDLLHHLKLAESVD